MHGLLGALTGVLALPPIGIGVLGLLWLVPWLLTVRFGRLAAALNGAILGAGFAAYSLYGIAYSHVTLFAAGTALTAGAFAVAGVAVSWRGNRLDACDIALGAAALGVALWAIRLCGLPVSLGLVVAEIPAGIRPAQGVGLFGLDVVLFTAQAATTSLFVAVLRGIGRREALIPALAMLAVTLGVFASGSLRMGDSDLTPGLRITIVQTAIEPWENAFRSADGVLESILARRSSLRHQVSGATTDLIIWPESSRPGFAVAKPDRAPSPTGRLFHAYQWLRPGVVRSVAVFQPPFGEPFQTVMPKRYPVPLAERGLTVSNSPVEVLRIGDSAIGTLICYEVTIPGAAAALARQGAELIVNITNDAYLGPSAIALIHTAAASLAAVRTGVPILRVANGGPSVLLLPDGTRQSLMGLYRRGTREVSIPQRGHVEHAPAWTWLDRGTVAMLLLLPLRGIRRRHPTSPAAADGRTRTVMVAAMTVGLVLPLVLEAQVEFFAHWHRMVSRFQSPTPEVRLTYHGVIDARQPHRAALAMLAREFGIAVTTADVPRERSVRPRWLAGLGLAVAPRANHRPPSGPGIAYGLLPPLRSPEIIKVSPDHAPVIFDPATGRFRFLTTPLADWLEDNEVHWVLPSGDR